MIGNSVGLGDIDPGQPRQHAACTSPLVEPPSAQSAHKPPASRASSPSQTRSAPRLSAIRRQARKAASTVSASFGGHRQRPVRRDFRSTSLRNPVEILHLGELARRRPGGVDPAAISVHHLGAHQRAARSSISVNRGRPRPPAGTGAKGWRRRLWIVWMRSPPGRFDRLGEQPGGRLGQAGGGQIALLAQYAASSARRSGVRLHRPGPKPPEQPVLHLGRGGLGVGQAKDVAADRFHRSATAAPPGRSTPASFPNRHWPKARPSMPPDQRP